MKRFEKRLSVLAATAALVFAGLAGCGDGSSGGSSGEDSGGSGGSGGSAVEIGPVPVALDVHASRVLADPAHSAFLALVGKNGGAHANSLVVVDAATGEILSSTDVGEDPSTMALSDDGSTLWVGLRGEASIRRVDLSSGAPVPGPSYALPGSTHAGEMVVLPGTKDSVAVSIHVSDVSPSYSGTILMDEGVERPGSTPGFDGAERLTTGPEGWLFGAGTSSASTFYSIQVTPDGLGNAAENEGLIHGYGGTQLVYSGGRVYSAAAAAVDVSSPAAPIKAGNFAYAGQSLHLIPSMERAILLSLETEAESRGVTLRYLDTSTFWLANAKTFTDPALQDARDLVSPDDEMFAFVGERSLGDPVLYMLTNPFTE